MENIIERLQLQSKSFQESFDLLSRSGSLEKLAWNFFLILRGSLLIVDAAFFVKKSGKKEWQVLFSKFKDHKNEYTDLLNGLGNSQITRLEHPKIKLGVTHNLIDKTMIGILVGSKLDKSGYTDFDTVTLQFYLQQLDSAYQFLKSHRKEKQLIFDLNHRVLQLNSLIDTGIEVARLQELTQLLRLSMERVLALTNASKGMLQVKNGRKIVEKYYFPFPFKLENDSEHQICTSFKFGDKKYDFYLCEKESRQGLINFDSTDQLLLDAFARQVHVSLENHYFHQQALEKERIDNEIALAGNIQKKLIPANLPDIPGYDQFGINVPTKFIGGDYYDCIPLKDGRFMFIMADVSGKGVAAGLLVSTLHASVHAYIDSHFELKSLVEKLNTVIWESSTIEKYITAFFALLDPTTGKLESVNAGHNPGYILDKNKNVEELSSGGIPLGMMDASFPYENTISYINPGDRLLLYTDGITEAINDKEQEYDDFRPLKEFFVSNQLSCAQKFIEALIADMQKFTGETPQSDDITALYLIREN